jgi:hypothetical protein
MADCKIITVCDPATPGHVPFGPAVAYCETHQCYPSSGLCALAHRDARIAELEAALRRALTIIDSPHYRDKAGVRPSANPGVDDIRELLAN